MPGCSLHALLPLATFGCELHTSFHLFYSTETQQPAMVTSLLPSGGIALVGAPDSDIGSRDSRVPPVQAMQVEMTQDIVNELLEGIRSGLSPQIFFGRTPVCVSSSLRAWSPGRACVLCLMAGAAGLGPLSDGMTLANHTTNSNSSTATRPTFCRAVPRRIATNCTKPAGLAKATSNSQG